MRRGFTPPVRRPLSPEVRRTPDHFGERTIFEGGGIPQPADKRELLRRFRERAHPELFPDRERILHDSVPKRFTEQSLGRVVIDGEPQLPVAEYKEAIQKAVLENQVTIISAETGAGKSTQVPQYLLELGFNVAMTQPRRLAAELVGEEIQRQLSDVLGQNADDLVGVHTAERNTIIDGKTKVRVLTDGLRLVQYMTGNMHDSQEVLLIDEVHEWNVNIEILIAMVKKLTIENPSLRVVIMSATMESQRLAKYLTIDRKTPPVLEIEGRNFGVEKSEAPNSTVVEQAVHYALKGKSILVFLPGVREICDTIDAINKQLQGGNINNVTLLPLHSKLSHIEQEAVKYQYPGPKIICATNIAQTSITIPDVDVVIDSGLERRNDIDEDNIESLDLRHVSRADLTQRCGRTGRVRPGTYVLTRLNEYTDFVSSESFDRTDYPIPEILRTHVDRSTLLTANAGISLEELELFHPIDGRSIEYSLQALQVLGALDARGRITARGRRMVALPMKPKYARMVIEAEDKGFDTRMMTYVSAMVSSMEVGGIPSWLRDASRKWRDLTDENTSDYIAGLDLFLEARRMSVHEQKIIGVDEKNVEKADFLFAKVCQRTGTAYVSPVTPVEKPSTEEREKLKEVIVAGLVNFVYTRSGKDYIRLGDSKHRPREVSDRSTVTVRSELIVATPYRVERMGDGSDKHIVQDITAFDRQLLGAVAQAGMSWVPGEREWRNGQLKQVEVQMFLGKIATGVVRHVDPTPSKSLVDEVVYHLMENSGNALAALKKTKSELEHLRRLAGKIVPTITQDMLRQIVVDATQEGRILDEQYIDAMIRRETELRGIHLDAYISAERRQEIYDNSPDRVIHNGTICKLHYTEGQPYYVLSSLEELVRLEDGWALPDGRPIYISFRKESYEWEMEDGARISISFNKGADTVVAKKKALNRRLERIRRQRRIDAASV